ncbi:GGDEF domain-containing protein [Conexibacter sp. CPCC 206217]|uniref:GGDEF domain-containing protein n=1 Tax=Conexibacter sp. CPCC 206217 TaxID=3064574 RepID=UPI0027257E5E|nr:GGDEF domain-containing protein [Conexibacter sp. CPCC 206217]MDO8210195.1 GGDEF domain-containing protein [Conexibacter sp. CPCC 206217]
MSDRDVDQRVAAFSAAAIFAGAAFLGVTESLIPGGESFSPAPGLAAGALMLTAALAGPRMPRLALASLGPLGAALVAVALVQTHEYGDGAVLYMLPALWMALFFGVGGTAFIVVWIGAVQAVALALMPAGQGNVDRWLDVQVAVLVVALVVRVLATRNDRLVKRLVDQARVDPLTGLLNRRGFDERMAVELSRAIRERGSVAIATFDLDHFKRVNDEHGHEMGDRVLAWVGQVLSEQVRGIDVAARFGGEEFVVALPRTDRSACVALAERVRTAVASGGGGRARFGISPELRVTVSGGVAAAVAPIDVQALLAAADRALYSAKDAGRDRIAVDWPAAWPDRLHGEVRDAG